MTLDLKQQPHRRFNPLTREWVLVSPHRTQRPWQGQVEKPAVETSPQYDPDCYLCPGNARAGGQTNPKYDSTFVFRNDFAALLLEVPVGKLDECGLIRAEAERGTCDVICFHPRHDLTLARMAPSDIRRVVDVWAQQTELAGAQQSIGYVQIFENRGSMMGASNPHPHCQVWCTEHIPDEPAREAASFQEY